MLVTDASDLAVSAVLNQRVGEELAPVSYYSMLLTSAERNYSTIKKNVLLFCSVVKNAAVISNTKSLSFTATI